MKTRRTRVTPAGRSPDHDSAIFETPSNARIARRGSTRMEPSQAEPVPCGRGGFRNPEA